MAKTDNQWQQDLMNKDDGFLQVFDTAIPSRARLTCPTGLSIKPVKDHNGKTTHGVFAKKIIQVKTRFGPLLAPVKTRQKTTSSQTSDGKPAGEENDGARRSGKHQVQAHNNISESHPDLSTEQIQEVALDQNNVEHQDIVQQALGIVKVQQDQMMDQEIHQSTPGPYGDAATTLAHSLTQPSGIAEAVSLVTTLASGDMSSSGQYGTGVELSLSHPLDTQAYTSQDQQQLLVAGLMTQNHVPLHGNFVQQYSTDDQTVQHNQVTTVTVQDNQVTVEHTTTDKVLESVGLTNSAVTEDPHTEKLTEPHSGKKLAFKTEERIRIDPADQPFELKIFHDDSYEDVLDLSDEETCNWMMLVRPARTRAEQNVIAVQLQDKIYFVSTEPIPSNTEIRVWYAPDYAKQIGKDLLYENKVQAETSGQELEAHTCPGPLPDGRKLRGRQPRKGRPRKYVKPSKTWRQRLEKTRLTKLKTPLDPALPPRKRGRPPKLRSAAVVEPKLEQVEDTENDPNFTIEDSHMVDLEDDIREDYKNDDEVTLDMIDDVLGEDEDFPYPKPSRRGRRRRRPGAPRVPRIPKKDPLQCPHCEEKFTKEALFVIHVAEHTGIKPYICEVEECSKGFMSKFKLERHRLIHTCPRSHKCPYCDKSFNRKDHLKNHMITHDPNKKRWVCEECGKEYSYNFSYRTHKAFHDADAGRTLECGICHKNHNSKEELLYHLKVHSGARSVKNCTEKTHACNDCGKKFYTRKDVRRHMITHTKKKDFLCQHCPQRFGRKDHLTRHLRSSHTGDANQKTRTPKGERKVRLEMDRSSSIIGLSIPRDDQNILVPSQQSLNYQLHSLPQEFRDIPVPLHMFENTQQLITIASAAVAQNPVIQAGQQQQQPQQQQQQHQVLQSIPVQHNLGSQIQIGDNRYSIIESGQPVRQQHMDNSAPVEYRALHPVSHTQVPTMYMQLGNQAQQQQQQSQQPQQQMAVASREANIDLTRTNGTAAGLQPEYQAVIPRTDQQNGRATVVQAADNTRQNTQQAQTFSTLLGYMETLRFLENLPTNAQSGVLAQIQMQQQQQQDGQHAATAMIPIQSTLSYTISTTAQNNITTQQLVPVPDLQKKPVTQGIYQQTS